MKKWRPSKINDKWMMTKIAGNAIAIREMKWWERLLYWIKIYINEYSNPINPKREEE